VQVATLSVAECLNCLASPGAVPTNVSALYYLQGLRNLQKFYNLAQGSAAVTSFSVSGTGLVNLNTFAGLQCAPGSISIRNNPQLVLLNGLDFLNTTLRPGPVVTITGNALLSPSSVAPLRSLAGCPAPGVPPALSSSVTIATAGCTIQVPHPKKKHNVLYMDYPSAEVVDRPSSEGVDVSSHEGGDDPSPDCMDNPGPGCVDDPSPDCVDDLSLDCVDTHPLFVLMTHPLIVLIPIPYLCG
jgi:hypothetical protein